MATVMHQAKTAIAATGTAVALASAQEVKWVILYAPVSNELPIKVGSSTVTDTEATTDGYVLRQGKDVKLSTCDLADVFINGYIGDCVYWMASSG